MDKKSLKSEAYIKEAYIKAKRDVYVEAMKQITTVGIVGILGLVGVVYLMIYAMIVVVVIPEIQTCSMEFNGEMNMPFLNNTYVKGGASVVMPCSRMMEIVEKS